MGDTVENNAVNSCPYEDYSTGMSVPEPLVSLAVPPAVDLSQASSDSFSRPLRLPTHLSAHDNIRISDGQGGTRDLELIDLVREARSNPQARNQLLTLAQAAASDPRVTSTCFVASEENLLPILAQLGSNDLTARREGALSLKQFIQSNPEDRRLQQGLIATIDEIARQNPQNVEARQLLVEVYRDSSPRNAGLRHWMQANTGAPSYATGATVASANNPATGKALAVDGNGGGGSPTLLPGSASISGDPSTSAPSANASLPLNQLLAMPGYAPLAALIEQRTQGTPLQGLAPEGIVGFALSHSNLPASEFKDLLYLRIMAAALPLQGFTGALFGQSMIAATSLAQDIRRQIQGQGSHADRPALALDGANSEGLAPANAQLPAPAPVVSAPPIQDPASASLAAVSASLPGGFPSISNFFVPSLVTSLSGMQALAGQPTLGPSVLASQAFGFSNHSHYHVEGPTNLDEDGHQGFGGGQGQGGNQGQDGHDEPGQPQDSYYA